jgi:1-acyl-sn-glycerol-3-phosphate acyltransferase
MRETSRRPPSLTARRLVLVDGELPADTLFAPADNHRAGLLRPLRVMRRAGLVLLWTLSCAPFQMLFLLLPGRAKVTLPKFYWSRACSLLGLQVRVIGTTVSGPGKRPVVFVSNHSSWLDIPVLGGQLDACFVSKDEVAGWPGVGTVARLGRTVFVSRQRQATRRERDVMRERLSAGDNLLLFPEGTTSDGARVMPFRTPFFAVAEGADPPLIQPVSVVYDRLAGLPTGRASRPVFAWYGDMDLASHFWRLGQYGGLRDTVLLHPPLDPVLYAGRKELSQAVWRVVADGASRLRQNRPVEPAPIPTQAAAKPAYS